MHAINLAEAKARLSELVSKAESGEETITMRRGEAGRQAGASRRPEEKISFSCRLSRHVAESGYIKR